MSSSRDLATLTADDFEPLVGDLFLLQSADGQIPLRLVQVRKLGQAQRAGDNSLPPYGPCLCVVHGYAPWYW